MRIRSNQKFSIALLLLAQLGSQPALSYFESAEEAAGILKGSSPDALKAAVAAEKAWRATKAREESERKFATVVKKTASADPRVQVQELRKAREALRLSTEEALTTADAAALARKEFDKALKVRKAAVSGTMEDYDRELLDDAAAASIDKVQKEIDVSQDSLDDNEEALDRQLRAAESRLRSVGGNPDDPATTGKPRIAGGPEETPTKDDPVGAGKPKGGSEAPSGGAPAKDQAQSKSAGGDQKGGQPAAGGGNPGDMMKSLAQLAAMQPPPVPPAQQPPPPQPMDAKAAMCASNPRAPDCAQTAANAPERPEAMKQPDPGNKKPGAGTGKLADVGTAGSDLNLDSSKFPRQNNSPPPAASRGAPAGVGTGMGQAGNGNKDNSAYGAPAAGIPVAVNGGNFGGGGGFSSGSASSATSSKSADEPRRVSDSRRNGLNSARYSKAMHDSILERYRRGPSANVPVASRGRKEITGPGADNFQKMRQRFQNLIDPLRE